MKKYLFLLSFLLVCFSSKSADKKWVDHLEPTFWWTDMKQTQLQLMFHGQNIAKCDFTIQDKEITIIRKELTDNPNYVFLYIDLQKADAPRKFQIVLKKEKKVQQYWYELKERRANSSLRESFTSADAVYLLMPDRFCNGNTVNDSVKGYFQGAHRELPNARHGGDIEGIISKIPYLADLGITALWTTPLFEDNDTQYSYHHYACTNYYKVDPRLGNNTDYLRLADTCHAYGLKLLIDVVPNHCGWKHWWLNDIPDKNWFNTWKDYTSSNYRITAWTDPHASEADREKLIKGWFAPNMPDLNLNFPLLFDYLRQAYIFWIEYAGIDGMRVDTYPYNDIKAASRFIQSILEEYPKMNVVGECWVKTPAETAYYQTRNRNTGGFDSHLSSVMDFCLKDVFSMAFNEKEGWENGMMRFYSHFAQDFVYPNSDLIMTFLDNHDIDRFQTAVKNDIAKYKMALTMLLTVRGYPQIYYGTEIMMPGIPGSYEGHRFDFPGGWPDDQRYAFIANGRTTAENEIFNYLRHLLHYRKKNTVLQTGKMKQFIPENGIYVFFRYNADKTVMIVANNNEQPTELNLQRFNEMLERHDQAKEIFNGNLYNLKNTLSLPAKSVMIYELL
ncbi:MAG: cyclomaltodextrinase N-terminal domain-containing protein [Paludibacteraceae bacterium]|nr:cyclomaltodextrinase N-terminal domain-containing protein [Paludibacteraceae bacterium]